MEIDSGSLSKCFVYFYKQIYGCEIYWDKTSNGILDKFLDQLKKYYNFESLGVRFLTNYLCFQYLYWDYHIHHGKFKQSLRPNHLFGPSALKRFRERETQYDTLWQSVYCITFTRIAKVIDYHEGFDYSERDPKKALFHNTEEGFDTCIQLTSLYNHKDTSCTLCKFQVECKRLLVRTYPRIARQRKYVK